MKKYPEAFPEVDEKTEIRTVEIRDEQDTPHSTTNVQSDQGSSDFEDEIEKELNAMNSTLSVEQRDKVSYSTPSSSAFEVARKPQSVKPGTGALQLKAPKSKRSPPPTEASDLWNETEDHFVSSPMDTEPMSEGFDDWGSSWGDNTFAVGLEESTAASHSKSPVSTNSNSPARQSTKKLGSEFDIMSIDVKKKEEGVLDFFAGMEPEIWKQSSLLDTLAGPAPTATEGKISSNLTYNMEDTGNLVSNPLAPEWYLTPDIAPLEIWLKL